MGCKQLQLSEYFILQSPQRIKGFSFVGNESDIQYSESQHRKDRPTGFSEYTYDLSGNRIKYSVTNDSVTNYTDYTYNNNDQLLTETNSVDGQTTYQYNANGSLIGKVNPTTGLTASYTYNLQNRLSTATISRMEGTSPVEISANYAYNHNGIRVRSNSVVTTNGTPSNQDRVFLVDSFNHTGYAQVIDETLNGVIAKSYTIGSTVLSQTVNGIASHLLKDGHGSTRLLTSQTGNISARFAFDAYGKMLGGNPNITTPSATDMLYSGEQFDNNLQMQYLRARYYDQNNGTFNRLDPFNGNMGDPQSLHKYAYCHGDGVNGIDPSGLMGIIQVFGAIAVMGILLTLTGCGPSSSIGVKSLPMLQLNVDVVVGQGTDWEKADKKDKRIKMQKMATGVWKELANINVNFTEKHTENTWKSISYLQLGEYGGDASKNNVVAFFVNTATQKVASIVHAPMGDFEMEKEEEEIAFARSGKKLGIAMSTKATLPQFYHISILAHEIAHILLGSGHVANTLKDSPHPVNFLKPYQIKKSERGNKDA